nr:uncharacterized protein LOC109159457 [Ipomoea batatas]
MFTVQLKTCWDWTRDWYGILQVDRSADEVTIKKQYRKLALVLHPDKNKFPGAEAAFKIIGEANVVLSDQTKRSIYDSKCRASVRSTSISMRQPPHQVNPPVRSKFFSNGFTSQFSGQNHYQKVQSTSSVRETSFWTTCPFCSVRFQYMREIVNRAVCCQNCLKSFIAYDLGYQGVPTGVGLRQPSQPQQRVVPNQGTTKMAANTAGFPSSHKEFQHGSGVKWFGHKARTQRGNTSKVFEDLKAKEIHGNGVNSVAGGLRGAGTRKVNEWPQDCRNFKNKSRKRSRKQASESSESFDTSSGNESEDFNNEKGSNPAGGQGHGPNDSEINHNSAPTEFDYPDQEFHDFDKIATFDIYWTKAGLPVGCGKFKRGSSDSTDKSHLILSSNACGKAEAGIVVGSLSPNKHQSFKYEIVEVLDYIVDIGFRVGYLNKLDGFVSLFQRTSQGDADSSSFLIKRNELHRLTGTEREGVPKGSFELDLTSIPQDPNDLWYPLKDVIRNVEPEVKSPGRKMVSDGEMAKLQKSPKGCQEKIEKRSILFPLLSELKDSTRDQC